MRPRGDPDTPTVLAIGTVAYVLANVTHELLGHGGACLAVGGTPIAVSSAWFHGDLAGVSAWGVRAEKAAGTVANLFAGALFLLALPWARGRSGRVFYFFWLAMVVNLFQGGGYLLTSPLFGFGDWKEFVGSLSHPWAWRVGLTAVGLALYVATLVVGARTLDPLLGPDPAERGARARRLCWLPYFFSGGLVFSLAALLNPYGKVFVLSSALAHLGGTAWLLWLPAWVNRPWARRGALPRPLERHVGWLAAGMVAFLVCVFVLGPAVRF